jgi:hypothetical protein
MTALRCARAVRLSSGKQSRLWGHRCARIALGALFAVVLAMGILVVAGPLASDGESHVGPFWIWAYIGQGDMSHEVELSKDGVERSISVQLGDQNYNWIESTEPIVIP